MASSFSQSRVALSLSAAIMLGACSGSDRLPPAEVSGVPKGMRGEVELVGRVGDVELDRRDGGNEEPIAYAAPAASSNGGSAAIDYLNTPNLAGTDPGTNVQGDVETIGGQTLEPSGMSGSQTLASASTDDARQGGLVIPEGGVNIDAELGLAAAEGEGYSAARIDGVQPQIVTAGGAMAIAEGNTSQPVVDGIGFDNPTSLNAGVMGASGIEQVADGVAEMQAGEQQVADDRILPLAEDSGNTGMDSADSKPAVDCSLYLDKRNCPKG
jgi:hypothetical protein